MGISLLRKIMKGSPMPPTESKFIVKLEHQKPVELFDFTDCMSSFGQQYHRYVKRDHENTVVDGVRLYIEKIEAGSILSTIVPYAAGTLPILSHINNVVSFSNYLKLLFSYLLGKEKEPPQLLEKADYEQVSTMLNPVANDADSKIVFHTKIQGDVNVVLNIGSTEANAIQNRARKEIEQIVEPVKRIHDQVVMYLYQARNDKDSKAGNFGIVEKIFRKPVKLRFGNNEVRDNILGFEDGNPFKKAYVVDLEVETVEDRPVLYKITGCHEHIDLED